MCFSMAPSFPRRGPGFQLKMLSLLCSCNRLGTSLLKRYSGLCEECLLSCASRKMALALCQTDQVAFQGRNWIHLHPGSIPISTRDIFFVPRKNIVVRMRQKKSVGIYTKLNWMNGITAQGANGAGVSSGSTITGVPSCGSVSFLRKCLF